MAVALRMGHSEVADFLGGASGEGLDAGDAPEGDDDTDDDGESWRLWGGVGRLRGVQMVRWWWEQGGGGLNTNVANQRPTLLLLMMIVAMALSFRAGRRRVQSRGVNSSTPALVEGPMASTAYPTFADVMRGVMDANGIF